MAGNKAIIHCCIEREVYELLLAHCEKTGQTKTTAVKRAIRAYCEGEPKVVAKVVTAAGNGEHAGVAAV